jgi:hypothetical protein
MLGRIRADGSPAAGLDGLSVPGLDAFTEVVGIDEVRALEERYRA